MKNLEIGNQRKGVGCGELREPHPMGCAGTRRLSVRFVPHRTLRASDTLFCEMTQSVWNCIPTPERGNDEIIRLTAFKIRGPFSFWASIYKL